MLAALGLFVFELPSLPFAEATHRREWRHERAGRVGVRDASQYVGPGDELVTLNGVLAPGVVGSYGAIDTIVEMGDSGDVFEFVDGTGRVWGSFVIVGLDTRRRHLMIDGAPRMIDFAIDLRRVSSDRDARR